GVGREWETADRAGRRRGRQTAREALIRGHGGRPFAPPATRVSVIRVVERGRAGDLIRSAAQAPRKANEGGCAEVYPGGRSSNRRKEGRHHDADVDIGRGAAG